MPVLDQGGGDRVPEEDRLSEGRILPFPGPSAPSLPSMPSPSPEEEWVIERFDPFGTAKRRILPSNPIRDVYRSPIEDIDGPIGDRISEGFDRSIPGGEWRSPFDPESGFDFDLRRDPDDELDLGLIGIAIAAIALVLVVIGGNR